MSTQQLVANAEKGLDPSHVMQMGTDTSEPVAFDAPGSGAWIRDRVHMPRPWTCYSQEVYPPALAEGFRAASCRYGWLVDHLAWGFVHGLGYFCVHPVQDAEVAERVAAAEQALTSRVWREDVVRWERDVKPAAIRVHLALQAVDPAALARDELLGHLERCREHHRRMIVQHHTFNGAALGPVGDLIAHVTDWTGVEPSRIVALARGSAPESAAESVELTRLMAALADDPRVRRLLEADYEPGETLVRLRAASPAAAAYLHNVGYRLLDSLDVGDPYVLEVPEVLVRRLRRATERGIAPDTRPSEHEVARVRDRVPAQHREEFDTLHAAARLTSRVRDERSVFSDVWAGGLARRAILAAGELVARDGRIETAAHMVDARFAEMRELIAGTGGPSGDELAQRAQARVDCRTVQTPSTLGDPPHPPPPLDALPRAAARATRALYTAIDALFGEAEIDSEPATVRGIAASPGTYTGSARVIHGPEEFARLGQGDVLVAVTTTESLNTVLPLLGALVTDSGGLLSHAAIVSRECGIPGVVGTRDATMLIPDGALIRVSGDFGEVEVMG